MTGSPYSPLKVFHHRDRLDQLKRGEQIVPTQVQLFISDLCNQDCGFCAYRMSGYPTSELFVLEQQDGSINRNPKRMISYDKACEILDDCHTMGVKAIQFTGGGEPTVHPNAGLIFQHVLDFGMDLSLVTNGVLLPKFFDQLIHAKWVRISIDAGNAHTYAETRRVSPKTYDRVWDNVRALVKAKDDAQADDLIIGIGFVISRDNWHQVLTCAEIAKIAGVDNIRISGLFQPEDERYFENFHKEASELCRQAKDLENGRFKVFNMFGDRVSDLAQHHPEYSFCGYQHFNTLIGGDLNVYRCCVTAYSPYGLIGSLRDQRLKDLWASTEKQDDFNRFDARNCPRCMFNNRNNAILYALDPNPRHVNFV